MGFGSLVLPSGSCRGKTKTKHQLFLENYIVVSFMRFRLQDYSPIMKENKTGLLAT